MSCTHCHVPTAEGITLCARHEADLRRLLSDMPGVLEDADDTIAKLDQHGGGAGTNDPAAGSAAPLNLTASERARDLRQQARQWARTVYADDKTPGLGGMKPVPYLTISVDLIRRRDDAGQMLRALSEATRYLLVAIDRPPERIYLGTCGTTYEGVVCTDTITANADDYETRCRTCGATHYVEEIQQDRAAASWGHFDTLKNVVNALRLAQFPINPKSAQRWATKGELQATRCRVADRVTLYSPAQIIEVHERMRKKRGRPKRAA